MTIIHKDVDKLYDDIIDADMQHFIELKVKHLVKQKCGNIEIKDKDFESAWYMDPIDKEKYKEIKISIKPFMRKIIEENTIFIKDEPFIERLYFILRDYKRLVDKEMKELSCQTKNSD